MKNWWDVLDRRGKAGLLAGVAAIVLATVLAGWWLLRTEYAVLFSDLKPQDAATMAAELEKQKVAYTVADGGTTLLVDKAQVHATRMKLMGKDLPLHGAVGLELFNNTDFGMTEFAQKINYQRALQGELTRTILSFPEVRDARVHLALPEQGLFKQASSRPKAAITLTLRHGHTLRVEQVNGIQRLVAAAVPGLVAQEVTVVDHQGVAMSRASDGEAEAGASGRLDLKREMENHLSRKAGAVLERAFGPGQALASVDVTLNMDQVRVTTEDVIAAPDAKGVATGVLVRERESARDTGAPEARDRGARGSSVQRDVEYQTGRRVEQVVSQPGSIRRLHVVAVVRQALDAEQQEQVRKLVAVAVGASPERGDAVLVQSFQAPATAPAQEGGPVRVPLDAAPPAATAATAWPLAVVLVLAAGIFLALRSRKRSSAARAMAPPLTDGQRQLALRKVEAWLHEGGAAHTADASLLAEGARR
ncbi:flagellar basal-body MS-ring/collar protein FliF [Ramlibacter pallidus]|uniref:Flagellar M-ring protein FliF n=1 Tax=Ramlibacter pallidus TaxID=2780087 RepID=A0ABR9S0Z6_9BURK|nr:flagellar basal-body MS-ring/collar protein FliF [Ramlibacter pallidus]MBE7367194.1 flagellar M-ring protein FliF [Ramlibacter pallidus]